MKTTKKTPIKKAVVKKEPVAPKPKVVKKPKFKLISYTMKAVIPVGQYANLQPEVTVQAVSIEAAERAVMPYIETLFAKYRDGGVRPVEPVIVKPVAPVSPKPVAPILSKVEDNVAPAKVNAPFVPATPVDPVIEQTPITPNPVAQTIPLTVPFNRAKQAIESCTSHEALKLVSEQVEKSTKIIDSEKVELKKLVTVKYNDITLAKTV